MKTFNDFLLEESDKLSKSRFSSKPVEWKYYLIAIENYANYKAEIAHDNACKEQLRLISDNFRENAHKGERQSDIDVFQAIADTIKNHPQPENPYKHA